MAALDDAERAIPRWSAQRPECPAPQPVNTIRLPTRQLVSVVVTIGGMQLMASMDGPVAVFALPKIQNDLGLSDPARRCVITAYAVTFACLILLGGWLCSTGLRQHPLVVWVAVFTFASAI